jgi:hypothetical protein
MAPVDISRGASWPFWRIIGCFSLIPLLTPEGRFVCYAGSSCGDLPQPFEDDKRRVAERLPIPPYVIRLYVSLFVSQPPDTPVISRHALLC